MVQRVTTTGIRHWVAVGMLFVLLLSLAVWFVGRDTIPSRVRIATAERGGLYTLVGNEIGIALEKRLAHQVVIESSAGSQDNLRRLLAGEVDLAIVQGGDVSIEEVSVVTPLFPEHVMVIVRKESGITSLGDLAGRNVTLGKEGSGNRQSAIAVLDHFGIDGDQLGKNAVYFKELLSDPSLDGAFVTAGIMHPDLNEVLRTNDFRLLPIHSAPAIDMVHPFLRSAEIPLGLFAERPAVPAETIPTIATTAFLVTRHDAPNKLVSAALATVHEESLRLKVPTLIKRADVSEWITTRMHPVAQRYFHPSDQIGMLTTVMESMVAAKELVFAIGAGIFLLWHRWRRLKENENTRLISQQKEHLDEFLNETLRIEEAQMRSDDPAELAGYLRKITEIKLAALHEFTEEELRGDRAFSIFLTQCGNVMTKLQLKILATSVTTKQEADEQIES